MNMIADYFKDMSDYEYLEIPETGFIMYRISGEEFHIGHFYVVPEKRKDGNTMKFGMMGEQIARERGCKTITGIVTVGERDPQTTARLVKMYLQFGCTIAELSNNYAIIFKKDLI